jgi:fatty acid desaturase/membrane-associated phospholipid phosphatase
MNRTSPPEYKGKSLQAERFAIFLGLGLLVTIPYFATQYYPLFAAKIVPVTTLDRTLPLWQPAICLYLTLYLLLVLPLLLVRDANELRKMAFGFAWITVVSHLVFAMWPTAIPQLVSATQITNPILRMVLSVDTSRNALPSLHASLAIYCALCSARLLGSRQSRTAVWIWTFLILASTLLAKRHVLLDLVAGASLAIIAYAALFWVQAEDATESEALQETLRARAGLARGLEEQIVRLAKHDWRKRLLEVLCFASLGLIGVALTINGIKYGHWFLLPAGIVTTALALNAFVLLMHDGMHDTLVRNRNWNRVASVLIGSTFLMSFSAYRVLHTRHHKFLGDPRDPDDYKNYTQHRSLVWFLHFLRLSVGSLLYLMLIPILALKFGNGEERRRVLVEYAFLVALYSLLLRIVPLFSLAVVWFLPLLMVGTMTAIRGFTQHGITDAADPYIASRTILPNPIVGFFLLHENYHLEHHLFPEVPSYHLPRLHRLIWPKLPRAVSGRSYLGFLVRFFQATPRMDESPIGLEHPAAKSS